MRATSLKSFQSSLISKQIDCLPLHHKNKLKLYSRYVLSKAAWHFTIADLSKTWVIANLDNLVSKYICNWFDLPVSATLSGLVLQNSTFGLNLLPPSVKFTQCQTVCQNALRSSQNDDIKSCWQNNNNGMNLQCDTNRDTKEALKAVRSKNQERLAHHLTYQGASLSFLFSHSL